MQLIDWRPLQEKEERSFQQIVEAKVTTRPKSGKATPVAPQSASKKRPESVKAAPEETVVIFTTPNLSAIPVACEATIEFAPNGQDFVAWEKKVKFTKEKKAADKKK